MAGEMEIIFSLCARIHVLLRRETKRIVDVEWMVSNANYARAILEVSRATQHPELLELAERIETLHPLIEKMEVVQTKRDSNIPQEPDQESKYLFSLR